jgi:hypothetical protein
MHFKETFAVNKLKAKKNMIICDEKTIKIRDVYMVHCLWSQKGMLSAAVS